MQTSFPPTTQSSVRGQTQGQPEIGKSFPSDLPVAITEIALKKIAESKDKLGLPVKGLRVTAMPRSPMRADYFLRFVPEEEADSEADTVHSYDGIDLYIAADSAPYLKGATIDYLFTLVSGDFKVEAPLRKLGTPDGRMAAKVQKVLDEEVIPALATHGGGAVLIDYKDGIVSLELTGGCQGCSMAGATLRDGIEKSIRERVPEVQEVRDVTRHANGKNPYFQQ